MPRVMHKHNLYLWQPCYRAFVYHLTNVKAAYDFRCYVAHISSTHFFSICVTFSPMVAPTHTMLRFDIFNSKPGCKPHKIPVCTKWKNTFIPIPYWINVNVLLNSFCYSFFLCVSFIVYLVVYWIGFSVCMEMDMDTPLNVRFVNWCVNCVCGMIRCYALRFHVNKLSNGYS